MPHQWSCRVLGGALASLPVLLCLLIPALRAQPPDTPVLRIEAGMHTSPIIRIDVDAQARFLVTASHDKTARVWSLASGELLQVLRPPIGSGNEGKLNAVAISPDGAMVAAAGWTNAGTNAYNIYLFERASGRLQRRIGGLPTVILHLAYAPDGRYLAAALAGRHGIQVYETRDFREVGRDSDYGAASYWVEFDRRGHLVTSSYDGYVRLYDARFQRLATRQAPGGKLPFAVAFSPDGALVGVGFDDTTAVNVLASEDLSFRYAPDTSGVSHGGLNSLTWSRDGQRLYAGGRYRDRSGICPILQWSQAGRGPVTALPTVMSVIMDLRALADGRLVFGAADPAFGVFDAQGAKTLTQGPPQVDYRDQQVGLWLSHDGAVVQVAYETLTAENRWAPYQARLSLAEGRLLADPPPLAWDLTAIQRRLTLLGYDPGPADGRAGPRTRAAVRAFQRARALVEDGEPGQALQTALGLVELTPPRTTGLAVRDWQNSEKPTLGGTPLPLAPYEFSRALAIAPDGSRFLLGTEWSLHLFDSQGQPVWQVPAPSTTFAVNLSGDGRLAVAAFADGTLRWYRLRDGAELLALFLHEDSARWVLWTPEGFFLASPGGEALIGYHLHQGPETAGAFIKVDHLYRLFARPELVTRRLHDGIDAELQAALGRIGDVRQVLTAGLPPTLERVSPPESRQRTREFTLQVKVVPTTGGVGRVVYRVNGVVVGDLPARPIDIALPYHRRPFTLTPGRNVISVSVFNAQNTVESAAIETVVHVQADERRPALYVLAIGVANYRDRALQLRYAAADAQALVDTLRRQGQRLFTTIAVKSLLERDATLANLETAFQDLAGKVQEHDVFVLYLAGHGMTLDGEYYFIPWDMRYENQQALRAGSVHQERLQRWLSAIKAQKSLLLLDTCASGAFVTATSGAVTNLFTARNLAEKGAIDKLMRATGRAVIAASTEQQFALEGHGDHGVFTYALLQGLRGQADAQGNRDGEITVHELAAYVATEVPQITLKKWNYEQVPMHQLGGRPFAIGLVPR